MTEGWTDDDVVRVRGQLSELVGGLPGVVVEDSFGHTSFMLKRQRLAWLLVDHHGDGRIALCVKAPPGEQEALIAADRERYLRPAYVTGWVGVELYAVPPDWDEVGELLEQAWRMLAGKRAVAAFDAGRGGQ
jgi:hypothetical protein